MHNDVIIFASSNGTTKETVDKIKKSCKKEVKIINLNEASDVDLGKYDRVFIGCGIYASRLNNKISNFLKTYGDMLKTKKIVFFIHGLDGEASYLDIIKKDVEKSFKSSDYKAFYLGGKINIKEQNFVVRLMFKGIAKKRNLDMNHMSNLNDKKIAELIQLISS
jgi:menaquinone-dependent protoporphyrinogen IX oxidase